MRFPEEFLNELKSRVRLSDVVGKKVSLKKRGKDWIALDVATGAGHTAAAFAPHVAKVIASAAANAQNNAGLDPSTLVVATVYADEGPTAKRIRPRAQGRAYRIRKRTSHITVIVESRPSRSDNAKASASASATRSRCSATARASGSCAACGSTAPSHSCRACASTRATAATASTASAGA